MIVVDASAAVLALLRDGDARDRLANEALTVPHLADSEVVQAIRSHARRGDIDDADAARAVRVWSQLGVHRVGVVGLLERVWELRANLTASDATYVAVAEAIDAPLLTADARLARAPTIRCDVELVSS